MDVQVRGKYHSMLLLSDMRSSVFKIMLSNGFAWQIRGRAETEPWVQEMAGILGVSFKQAEADANIRIERLTFEAAKPIDPLRLMALSSYRSVSPDKWSIRAWSDLALISHEKLSYIIAGVADVPEREGRIEQMRKAMLPFYEKVAAAGGLPIHAAMAEIEGQGILLAGISGAGKSTCCRRLPLPWRTLGDDMGIVVPCEDGTLRGHPLPTWSAVKAERIEWPCIIHRSVPIRTILFLARSDTDEVVPISGSRAALSIYNVAMQVFASVDHSAHMPGGSTYKRILFENAAAMAAAVPAFILRLSLQGRFWEKIEEVLEKRDIAVLPGTQKYSRTLDLPLRVPEQYEGHESVKETPEMDRRERSHEI